MRIDIVSDRDAWERFRETHAPGALFQSWTWGDVIRHQSLPLTRFGLYDESRLAGIFQVVTVRARRGTYLHVRHGPIIIGTNPEDWELFITFLQNFAKNQGASFIRMNPPFEDTQTNRTLLCSFGMRPAAVHEVDAERCWVLDITPSENSLLSGMRKTTRYEIKRAIKEGVIVEKSEDPKGLQTFFDLYKQTATRQGFVPHQGIREEFDVFAKVHRALLFTGVHEGKTVAAAIVLFMGNVAIYHHGASVTSRIGVSYLVQWEAIREAKRRGMRVYNFWGIAPPGAQGHPWHGITLFKSGFGGREARTIHAHDLPLSPRYWVTRSVEWWERKRRGY
ncbi:MAG: peptidoglycan bridge formation glycyltransferase FemA/FemB family protein [Patescibacteria group bacterium]